MRLVSLGLRIANILKPYQIKAWLVVTLILYIGDVTPSAMAEDTFKVIKHQFVLL